ncbi:glycosyltransferase family 2 protein (plasmid) [Bernardetia sp. Wsw4-3y2]|uniref:glycosyltransferase family 2 protein n=1 Tax=Bernardetia sp. Wsw4-3y2 TaxID=3127471 RepID=UPI0030CB0BC9
MKLSIITVVRNAKELFLQTLESVKNQTYQNIEYVVVDGNSSDGTKQLIEENQEFITTWISEKDKSLYDAMNKGLKLSIGDFVLFLHAGDTIPTPQTLENAINDVLNKETDFQKIDFIYGKVKIKHLDNSFTDYHKIAPTEKQLAKLGYKNFLEGMVICHQAMLVRREIAPLYDLDFRLAGDIDWSIRLFKEIEKRKKNKQEIRVKQTEIVIAHFLAGGISTSQKKKSLQERFAIFEKHIGFVGAVWQHFVIFGKRFFK